MGPSGWMAFNLLMRKNRKYFGMLNGAYGMAILKPLACCHTGKEKLQIKNYSGNVERKYGHTKAQHKAI